MITVRSANMSVLPLTPQGSIPLYVIGTRKGVSASSSLGLKIRTRAPRQGDSVGESWPYFVSASSEPGQSDIGRGKPSFFLGLLAESATIAPIAELQDRERSRMVKMSHSFDLFRISKIIFLPLRPKTYGVLVYSLRVGGTGLAL